MNNPFNSDFLKQRWSGGDKIGLFDNFYKFGGGQSAAQQQPASVDATSQAINSLKQAGIDVSKIDPNQFANAAFTAGVIGSLNKPQFSLPELEAFREREARRAQELGKESLEKTMKAKMLYDGLTKLPENVAKAFSGPASIYYAGMSQVPAVYNQAVSAFRPLALTGTSVVSPGSVPSYFS